MRVAAEFGPRDVDVAVRRIDVDVLVIQRRILPFEPDVVPFP
jgi:hypothetical protein